MLHEAMLYPFVRPASVNRRLKFSFLVLRATASRQAERSGATAGRGEAQGRQLNLGSPNLHCKQNGLQRSGFNPSCNLIPMRYGSTSS